MISLPYPPSTNRYWKNFRGRMVISAEAREYKRGAAEAARLAGMSQPEFPIEGAVELMIEFNPKATKSGAESKTRLDLDNVLKVAIDSMNGIAYTDDKQVRRISAHVGPPVEGGGLRMWITPYHERHTAPITGETA